MGLLYIRGVGGRAGEAESVGVLLACRLATSLLKERGLSSPYERPATIRSAHTGSMRALLGQRRSLDSSGLAVSRV